MNEMALVDEAIEASRRQLDALHNTIDLLAPLKASERRWCVEYLLKLIKDAECDRGVDAYGDEAPPPPPAPPQSQDPGIEIHEDGRMPRDAA